MVSTSKQTLGDLHPDPSHSVTDEAHDDPEAAETRTYLTAYEQCTAPFQRRFNSAAELDADIVQQLTHAHFPLTIEPNIQAKLDKLVQRIRNTWVKKYNFVFGNDIQQNPGVLQPTSLTWKAPGYNDASSRGVKPGAVGDGSRASAPSISKPSSTPAGPANRAPSALPQLDEFTFTAPGPDEQVHAGRKRPFARNKKTPVQPLFANGLESKLAYFARYESLSDIYTAHKREKVKYLLELVPGESVAHCMEALWRCDDDLDDARQQLLERQEKQVIEIADSGGEEGDGGSSGRPKKKQKVATAPVNVKSKKFTKGEKRRLRRALGTLQKPSEKSICALRNSPEYTPFGNDAVNHGLSTRQPDASSTQLPAAPDYISLNDDAPAPTVRRPEDMHTFSQQRSKRPVDVIDLTTEDDLASGPPKSTTDPVSNVDIEPVVRKIVSRLFVKGLLSGLSLADSDVPTAAGDGRITANTTHGTVTPMPHASLPQPQVSQKKETRCNNLADFGHVARQTVSVPLEGSAASTCIDNGKAKIVEKDCTRDHTDEPMPWKSTSLLGEPRSLEYQGTIDQVSELEEGEILEEGASAGVLGEQHTSNHQSDAALRTLADVRGSNPESVDFSLGTLYNSIQKAHQLDQAQDRA